MRAESPSKVANIINLIAIPIAFAAVLLVALDINSPVRIWVAFALFAFGPGSGLVQFLRIPDAALQIGLIVAISMSIDLLLGQTLLGIHNVSGSAAVCILAGLTCLRPIRPKKTFLAKEVSEQP